MPVQLSDSLGFRLFLIGVILLFLIGTLYGIVEGADVGPTPQVVEAAGGAERALRDTLARWQAFERR